MTTLLNKSPSSVYTERIQYTPSSFARNALLYLQETGTLKAVQSHTNYRDRLSSYLCFIVLEGKGILQYEGKEYSLQKGDIAFIDCTKQYSHTTVEPDLWSLQWCHFNGNSMKQIYEKYRDRGGSPVIHAFHMSQFTDLLTTIYAISTSDDSLRDMHINEKLIRLVTLINEEAEIKDTGNHANNKKLDINQVKQYLDEHYHERITLDELSSSFFINKFYLTRVFKETYGTTINNYILSHRITESKQLLRFTDYSIEHISETVGMEDAGYFARAFKKIEGISPTEYRKQW